MYQDEQSVIHHLPCCLPADGGCVQGASADGHTGCQPGHLAQQRMPPASAHTSSHVADRTYMPRSPEGPGSNCSSWAPSCPCRAPCLPASQCPRSASSLPSPPSFFPPLFSSLVVAKGNGRGEKEGSPAVKGKREETEEGPRTSLLCLSGKRWVLILLPQLPSREVTSFPPLALCFMQQRRRGRSLCQAGSMSPMLSEHLLCLGLCLGPCSCCPKQRGTADRWGWNP